MHEKALKIRKRDLGEEHPETATSYNNLALLYESMGEYTKIKLFYEKALKIREKSLGKKHPETAMSYNNLAVCYQQREEYSKAESLYLDALVIQEKILGESHPDTAISYGNLGAFYIEQKMCNKARKYLKKAIASVNELAYSELSLLKLKRALINVEKSMEKEKKAKFNKKGRYCVDG